MATKRPRTTISFDPEEYEQLRRWAESEFRTIPQLVSAIVKKSLLERSQDLKPGDKA
ncbi:hypothetical protein [Nostoc flagelliforme]|nr:hypothetical protein [Nostoc flagelliforme]